MANLTKVTDELSDAVKVKDEERAKLTEKIESLEYAASFHAVATLWGAKRLVLYSVAYAQPRRRAPYMYMLDWS